MRFAHLLMSGLALAGYAGVVHAQNATQPAPQTTAIIDPPIVSAPPLSAPPPVSSLTMPKWSEFPVPPTNVPTPAVFAARVQAATARQVQLSREMAAITWDNDIGEPFAAASRNRFKADKLKPIDPALSTDQINAYAASVRQRAAPPPVVN